MRRGTTPTVKIKLGGIDFDLVKDFYVTITQGSSISLTKTGEDLEIDEDESIVSVTLTEQETLSFNAKVTLNIQVRVKTHDDVCLATGIKQINVTDILWDEEI